MRRAWERIIFNFFAKMTMMKRMPNRPNSEKKPKGKRFTGTERHAAVQRLKERLDYSLTAFAKAWGVTSKTMADWAREAGYDHDEARNAAVVSSLKEGLSVEEIAKAYKVGVVRVKDAQKALEREDAPALRRQVESLTRECEMLRRLASSLLKEEHKDSLMGAFLVYLRGARIPGEIPQFIPTSGDDR